MKLTVIIVVGLVACVSACQEFHEQCAPCVQAGCYALKLINNTIICSDCATVSRMKYRIRECSQLRLLRRGSAQILAPTPQSTAADRNGSIENPIQRPTEPPPRPPPSTTTTTTPRPAAELSSLHQSNQSNRHNDNEQSFQARLERNWCWNLRLIKRAQRLNFTDATTARSWTTINPMRAKDNECSELIRKRREQRKMECLSCSTIEPLTQDDPCWKFWDNCLECVSPTHSCNYYYKDKMHSCNSTATQIPYINYIPSGSGGFCPINEKSGPNVAVIVLSTILALLILGIGVFVLRSVFKGQRPTPSMENLIPFSTFR